MKYVNRILIVTELIIAAYGVALLIGGLYEYSPKATTLAVEGIGWLIFSSMIDRLRMQQERRE